nr:hypothetical protein [Tanacetum cinerariifolium]
EQHSSHHDSPPPSHPTTTSKPIPQALAEPLTHRKYTRRAIQIAQSKALSPAADESASLSRDDRQGEAFLNVFSLDAGSMEAVNILTSGGAAASVSPGDVLLTVGVPTVSGSFPTVSAIFTTASVKVVESKVPKKRKLQEQIDAQVAREMDEEFARENHRLSEQLSVSEDVSEEELKGMMHLVPLEEVYVEALQVKHPIIDWDIHSEEKREYWKIIRLG